SSDIPEEKEDRHGLYITAKAGTNEFQWPMTWPDGPKLVATHLHGRPGGPLALPGTYSVRLDVGDWSQTQSFNLVKDPRIDTSDEAFGAQFGLLRDIQDKLSSLVEAVNESRALRKQLDAWNERLGDDAAGVVELATSVKEQLDTVEGQLVQAELTSPGDSLNYREMLFEKLSGLTPVVASADRPPTRQSFQVFEKLSGQIDEQLAALATVRDTDLAELNRQLRDLGVDIVGI
ncbi:MAG: glycosyl hydrolase, partial [Actinomycetia bacterium]|nr:glycosyl hydrolase [Actinomycetes bacterium]